MIVYSTLDPGIWCKKRVSRNTWQNIIVFWMALNDEKKNHIFRANAIYHAQSSHLACRRRDCVSVCVWLWLFITSQSEIISHSRQFEWKSHFHELQRTLQFITCTNKGKFSRLPFSYMNVSEYISVIIWPGLLLPYQCYLIEINIPIFTCTWIYGYMDILITDYTNVLIYDLVTFGSLFIQPGKLF